VFISEHFIFTAKLNWLLFCMLTEIFPFLFVGKQVNVVDDGSSMAKMDPNDW
jgi:hypothetical protein